MKEKLLIHACCGPCSAYPLRVLKDDFELLGFFSNSNIAPEEEYKKREQSFEDLCDAVGVNYVVDHYDPDSWNEAVKGLENEPERGKRCEKCFEFRLRRAFEFAKKNKIKYITTTLTVTPYKDTKMVFKTGQKLSDEYGVSFTPMDFKKNDGFKKTLELAKKQGLYLQKYCGCIYSLKDREAKQ